MKQITRDNLAGEDFTTQVGQIIKALPSSSSRSDVNQLAYEVELQARRQLVNGYLKIRDEILKL